MSAASLKAQRGKAKAAITRAAKVAQNLGEEISYEELEVRYSTLTAAWKQLSDVEDALCQFEEEERDADIEGFAEYEEKYVLASAAFTHAMRSRKTKEEDNSTKINSIAASQDAIVQGLHDLVPSNTNVALPKIVIPSFSGDYGEWQSFRDIYLGSIGNKSGLTLTQKFYYLISFLTGEAADLIRNIPITDEHFTEAWDKLEERYNRPHLVARSYLKNFMKLPGTSKSNPKAIRKILDGADECIRGLSAIKMDNRDPWLIYILLTKLDADTHQSWFAEVGARVDITIKEFLNFLDKRFVHLESTELLSTGNKQQSVLRSHTADTNSSACLLCKEMHNLWKCPEFLNKSEADRRNFVLKGLLCFNCLRAGHRSKNCRSTYKCRICNSRHHTLVHNTQHNKSMSVSQNVAISSTNSPITENLHENASIASNCGSSNKKDMRIILPTANVWARDKNGNKVKIRVLLDTGSEVSLITVSCAQLLGTVRYNARLGVRGIGSSNAGATKGVTHVTLFSCINQNSVQVKAFILPQVTASIPARDIKFKAWNKLRCLTLADSQFDTSAPIDMLLGADIIWSAFRDGRMPILEPSLTAINTIFGWVVSGQTAGTSACDTIVSYTTTEDSDMMLTRFWKLDECKPIPPQSEHDDPAEVHFRRTHSQLSDGRYVVELPFKDQDPQFGDTVTGAVQRLYSMERKFVNNTELKQEYSKFMDDYINLGHMELIPSSNIKDSPKYYLPHHAVLKPDSSTTKLRVVFDGSHKDSSGMSLNDTLMIGPPIQPDLFGVALRFRQHTFVFTADITKMFRQIWVAAHHRDYQRIVWRNRPEDPIQHFRLRTVTYGTASAPFHSVRVLQQIALDNQEDYPRAAKLILKNIYVDDILAGGESSEELFDLKSELVELMKRGGFHLRKWYSNSSAFLDAIPCEDRERLIESIDKSCVKILGLYWDPEKDAYAFSVIKSEVTSITKRHVLSQIAKIFDVFGFLAPVVVKLKIMLQSLWQLKVDWDTTLPINIVEDWHKIRNSMYALQNINIPRQIFVQGKYEIHIFCDASTDAYAAVIYSVSRDANPPIIRLIVAKSRVAPLKAVSVPRLELCAALLGARLYASTKTALSIETGNVFAWTDSQLVIHYLSSPPRKWKTFVSNRCEEILDILPRTKWRHVKTAENPADCASRGVYPEYLVQHKLWWNGPVWLADDPCTWASHQETPNNKCSEHILELKRVNVNVGVAEHNDSILIQLLRRYSSFKRVVRIVAYIMRAKPHVCTRSSQRSRYLTHEEIKIARGKLLSAIQQESFPLTIAALNRGDLSKKDPLLKLSPFLDSNHVLRVGGRINDATVPFDSKHPVILPKCGITANILKEIHEENLHAGVSHLFFIVRQQFWVLGARNMIRKIVHSCKCCFMQRKQTSSQLMAALPIVRIQPARPFLNSGCDFAGPITIKMTNCKKPRVCKAYICLFICLSTKAIHLELATDLSSEGFISAFIRFTSRRGRCANLYSDNGTNFHGANRILTEMHKLLLDETRNEKIHALLANDGTTWNFIPPSSPHFGGIWESNIRSVKLHMARVIGEHILCFDELYTVLTQIEAILNSRPLSCASDSDMNPITPAHFLIGEALTSVPVPVEHPINCSYASHLNWLRNMVTGFWKRWHIEYLSTLQSRTKWNQNQPNYAVGDIVVLKEPNNPPCKWLLGKIIETHPGPDGRVRVVTIKTKNAIYKRPIVKLAPLPCV